MALIVLTLVAVSSAVTLVTVPSLYNLSYAVTAERLSQQPDTYFVLKNPDAVVSQAISTPQEHVTICSLDETQLDELINEHNTGNVQVNDVFYQIGIICVDSFPPPFAAMCIW